MQLPPPPQTSPAAIEILIHFDSAGVPRYEGRGSRGEGLGSVDAAGNIDLTLTRGPVVLTFKTDPADHHPFDRGGALFVSDTPLVHTRRWRPDIQFRRVRLLDHGYTLTIDYHNINRKHGRPMPANGYDLAFRQLRRQDGDPAIKNGAGS
jgi:hypothetical protein